MLEIFVIAAFIEKERTLQNQHCHSSVTLSGISLSTV